MNLQAVNIHAATDQIGDLNRIHSLPSRTSGRYNTSTNRCFGTWVDRGRTVGGEVWNFLENGRLAGMLRKDLALVCFIVWAA